MKRSIIVRQVLPVAAVVLGVAVVQAAQQPSAPVKMETTVRKSNSPTPTPSTSPRVTVNGEAVPLDQTGHTRISLPGGQSSISISSGNTSVSTQTDGDRGSATISTGSNQVKVDVKVDANNSADTRSTSRVHTRQQEHDGSSYTSTQVFSSTTSRGR